MRDDRSYYLIRAEEESLAALRATHFNVRFVHEQMARLYRARAEALTEGEPEASAPGLAEPAAAA